MRFAMTFRQEYKTTMSFTDYLWVLIPSRALVDALLKILQQDMIWSYCTNTNTTLLAWTCSNLNGTYWYYAIFCCEKGNFLLITIKQRTPSCPVEPVATG